MAHKYSTFFKWINVVVDYFILNLTLFAITDSRTVSLDGQDHTLIIILLNLTWFFCSEIFGIYKNILARDNITTITATLLTLSLYSIIALLLKFLLPDLFISTFFLIYFFILFSALITASRIFFLLLRKYRRRILPNHNKVIIVGATPGGIELYNFIIENPQLGYDVQGIFDDEFSHDSPEYNYLGKIEDSIPYAKAHDIHEIYCALPNKKGKAISKIRKLADKHLVRFRLVADIKGTFDKADMAEYYGKMPIIVSRRQEPLDNKANEIKKWVFDIMFASLVIIFLLSWLIPLIALIIKLDSKGPVFFKQLRSGKDNKPFYCLKFRSMAPNKDCDSVQATKNDMRVTRVGAFLRKTSLDELPQFFNVLMGDMSVVGPRPHMLKHTEDYSQIINKYMVRQFLTPGITGWAQINGYRGETRETSLMVKRVQADIWYLENWTLFLDLKIIFLTAWQILTNNEKAY